MTAFEVQNGESTNDPSLDRGGKDLREGYGRICADAAIEAVTLNYTIGTIASDTLGENPTDKKVWARYMDLTAGEQYSFSLSVPAGADYDLYLYNGTPDANGDPIILANSNASTLGGAENIIYTPTFSGTYYIVVKWVSGNGEFTLQSVVGTGVQVLQQGNYFYMDNGVIRIGLYGTEGIEWFGGSPGPLTSAEVERMNALLAEKFTDKKNKSMGKSSEVSPLSIYPDNLYVYDEDCAIFPYFGASYASVYFDSGGTTEIVNPGPSEGVLKESGTGTVNGQPIVWERYTSLKPNDKFVTCRVVIKNLGSQDLDDIEFYEYMDMDLAGAGNDYAMVPLEEGDTRVHVETKYPSTDFVDNWIYQRDATEDRHVGLLMRTPEDVTDFYVGDYEGEDPPERININGQTITTGDIVWGVSWRTDIPQGGEQEFVYGLAAPEDLDDLKAISDQFKTEGVYVRLSAPEEAVQGERIAISANVKNYFAEKKTITVTLSLPQGLSLAQDSPPAEQQVNVQGGEQRIVSWVVDVGTTTEALGYKTISVTAVELESGESSDDTATIRIVPANANKETEIRTGVLVDDDSAVETIVLPLDVVYAEGEVTLYPSIELPFVDEVEYLIYYPYGCIEQKVSCLLADVEVYNYLENAGRLTSERDTQLRQDIVSGSLLIIDEQHSDKGWGWYTSYSSTPFFTCYALIGLLDTKQWATAHGIYIPPSDAGRDFDTYVNRGLEYLINNQESDGHWTGVSPDYIEDPVPLTSYILYVLGQADSLGYNPSGLGSAKSSAITWLKNAQNADNGWGRSPNDGNSDSFSTALAILALVEAGEDPSSSYLQNARQWLLDHKVQANSEHYWHSDLEADYYWFAHEPETTSFAMIALLQTGSSNANPEVANALDWMLKNTNTWLRRSTKDGATAVWMFNRLGLMPGTLDITIAVNVNGQQVASEYFTGVVTTPTTIDITDYLDVTGSNTIEFSSTGSGKVTYLITIDYWVPITQPSQSTLEKQLQQQQSQLNFTITKRVSSPIESGDKAIVTLLFTPEDDIRYVVIDDYIPAGFTLDTSLIPDTLAYEVSENRISFALENISAGDTLLINYEIIAPPTTLNQINLRASNSFLMYEPEVSTVSNSLTTEIREVNVWDVLRSIDDYYSGETTVWEVIRLIDNYYD